MLATPFLFVMLFSQQGGVAQSSDPAFTVLRLQDAIRANPSVESNYTDLGNLLLQTQNFPEAAVVLEAARRKFPNNPQAALSLGVAYYGLRRFPDAVSMFLASALLAPDIEQPIAFLDRISEHWGDRKQDVSNVFRKYAAAHPNSALAHLALGRATGDPGELRTSVRLNPRNPDAHLELGSSLQKARNYPEAIAAFRRAAELRPKDPVPHYRLALLYERTGEHTKAESERALHEKLAANEKAELDRRQAETKHLRLKVEQ